MYPFTARECTLPKTDCLFLLFGAEADDVDEADVVEPDGDAADNAGGVVPVGDGLEGGVVDYLEVFGFEAKSFFQGVDLMEGTEGVHDP